MIASKENIDNLRLNHPHWWIFSRFPDIYLFMRKLFNYIYLLDFFSSHMEEFFGHWCFINMAFVRAAKLLQNFIVSLTWVWSHGVSLIKPVMDIPPSITDRSLPTITTIISYDGMFLFISLFIGIVFCLCARVLRELNK